MIEFLLSLSLVANVILFICLVKTMAEKNAKADVIPKYAHGLEMLGEECSRLTRCYNRMKTDADYWMREAMRLKGHTPPPAVTDQPKPSPSPWTHPGRN